MIITTDQNTGQNIFVFGSNESGIHGAGAAKEARLHWGAIPGQGFGLMGHSFGIPTKDWQVCTLPLDVIQFYVARFIAYAYLRPKKKFLVTRIGCGLAGYADVQIAPMFKHAPDNCVLPEEWKMYL